MTKPPTPRHSKRKLLLVAALLIIIAVVVAFVIVHHRNNQKRSTTASATSGQTTSPAPTGGFPNASNTGVPAGTILTAYTGSDSISGQNVTISDKTINGCLTITGSTITIKDSKIICNKKQTAIFMNQATGKILITDSEVDGTGTSDIGVSGKNFTLERVNIHSTHDGIHVGNNDVVQDSYVHDLAKLDGWHSDTVQVDKQVIAHDDTFNHDSFDASLPNDVRLNSAFHVGNNISGNFIIENSYLDGGSFTMQFDPKIPIPAGRTIEIINNAFGRDCNDGIFDGGSSVTFTGNYWLNNHQPATAANSKLKTGCMGKSETKAN